MLAIFISHHETFEFTQALLEIITKHPLILVNSWEEANIIFKPTINSLEYQKMDKLRFLNNYLTSAETLTEKSSLLKTGLSLLNEEFFELAPWTSLDSASLRSEKGSYIVKPTNGFGGRGIKIFRDFQQAKSYLASVHSPHLVQKYIEPLLIRNRKFDLRMYVLMTPTNIFYYRDGFIRMAPEEYHQGTTDTRVHVTNCMLHGKRGVLRLTHLQEAGVTLEAVYEFIHKLNPIFNYAQEAERKFKEENKVTFETFEIFGLDIIFDREKRPWLLEINKNPSITAEEPLTDLINHLLEDTITEAIMKQSSNNYLKLT